MSTFDEQVPVVPMIHGNDNNNDNNNDNTISNGSMSIVSSKMNSSQRNSSNGALICTILSAYDLPAREQPLSIVLTVGNKTVTSGPPSARHKDRNSFKFSNNNTLRIEAPLALLYTQKATMVVQYRDVTHNLTADIVMNSLKVHETTWLILNLTSNEDIPPTLRLELRLEGPYRPEIGAILALSSSWFALVDRIETATAGIVPKIPPLPHRNFFLIPAVPVATGLVVLSPIVLGVALVGLPFILPILVLLATLTLVNVGLFAVLYASTSSGREKVAAILAPAITFMVATPSGQSIIYETGPRPTPVTVARWILPTDLMTKLFVSLLIDLLGSSSYLLPLVGEGLDLVWAPLQTILIMAMYDTVAPNLKYLSFLEEFLPLTDVVPSATIGWLTEFGPTLLTGLPFTPLTTSGPGGTVLQFRK